MLNFSTAWIVGRRRDNKVDREPRELALDFETLRAQTIAQDPLRTVGRLALGVGHDLANVIAAMRLRLQGVRARPGVPPTVIEDVRALERMLEDARSLLQEFQVLGQPPAQAPGAVDVANAVARAVELTESALRARAVLAGIPFALDVRVGRLPMVRGTAAELRRLFVNLIVNAAQAMPAGGTITIRAAARERTVVVTVADEGTGIAREHLRRLFEPFFTTKGTAGLGLGLTLCREIVDRAGGTITARGRRPRGAVFTVRLPRARG